MSWELVLCEDDLRLYRENVSLLEERVTADFPECYADPAILAAIRRVPRHMFVAVTHRALAYTDSALPTARGLTTSAPSVIAEMIFRAGVRRGSRVLEVGTGTGYQAAVLAEMGARVRSIEIDGALAAAANRVLIALEYKRPLGAGARHPGAAQRLFPGRGEIRLYRGNGIGGCPEGAPYDSVILSAAVPHARHLRTLAAELSPRGGRMVAPVGARGGQELVVIERNGTAMRTWTVEGIALDFVRMVLPPEAG